MSNPFAHIVCIKATESGINLKDNFEYLENLAVENLEKINNKKLKFDKNLIHLWAILDMRKYLESYYELVINPYIDNEKAVKDLDHYLNLPARYQNLLDIKFVNKIKICNVEFKKLYIATFEIKDEKYNFYRPYVELYIKNDDKQKNNKKRKY